MRNKLPIKIVYSKCRLKILSSTVLIFRVLEIILIMSLIVLHSKISFFKEVKGRIHAT